MIVLKIIGLLLKIVGWLLLVVLLVLLAALCVPVHLYVSYEPEVALRLRYLFLTFYIVGEKPPRKPPGMIRRVLTAIWKCLLAVLHAVKTAISAVLGGMKKGFSWLGSKIRKPKKKKAAAPRKKTEEKKQSFFGALKEQRGFFGALRFFADAGMALGGAVGKIYRGIRINQLVLHVSVSGDDAADTAIQYGRICAGAFPALSFLLSSTRGYDPASLRTNDIEIVPDFAGKGIRIFFIGAFTAFPIAMVGNLLWAVIKFAVAQLAISSKNKKDEKE